MNLAIHQSVKAAPYTSLCDYIPLSLYSVSVDYFYCFHNSNMFWLIAGSTLSYCPVMAHRLYNWLSEAHRIELPVRMENAQGSKLSIFFMLSMCFCISARMDDRLSLPSIGMTESIPVISTILKSSVNLMFTRSNLLIL